MSLRMKHSNIFRWFWIVIEQLLQIRGILKINKVVGEALKQLIET